MRRGVRNWILLAGMALVLAGCDLSAIMPTPFQYPTLTPQPTGSPPPTSTVTARPSVTPTQVTPAAVGTALPQASSPGETGDWALLADWGSGLPQQIAWSPDGAWLGVASSRGVQVYAAETLEVTRMLLRGELARSLAFSSDGSRLAAGMDNGDVAVFDLPEGKMLWRLPLAHKPVLSLAFAPDGALLATGAVDGELNLWRAADGALERALDSQANSVQQVAFIRDGEFLLSWSPRVQPSVFRLRDGKRMDDFYLGAYPGGGSAAALSVSADGSLVAAAQGARLRLLRGGDNTTLATISAFSSPVLGVVACADGSVLAAAVDGDVQIWSSQPAALLASLPLTTPARSAHLALSPDGGRLAVLTDRLRLWDIATGEARAQSAAVYATDFQLGGVLDEQREAWWKIASDGVFAPVELQSGEPLGMGFAVGNRPAGADYSPAGGWVAAADGSKIEAWQVQGETLTRSVHTLSGHKLAVTSLAIAPDGRRLASGSADGTVRLWDLAGGTEELQLEVGDALSWVQFSPDGRLLAACARQRVRVWDATSGSMVDDFDGYSLAFQPAGDLLAAAGFNQGTPVVRLRRLGVTKPLVALPVNAHRLTFSSGGDVLAVAGDAISMFAVPTGELLWQSGLDTPLRALTFMPGGRVLGAAWDGVITVYGGVP